MGRAIFLAIILLFPLIETGCLISSSQPSLPTPPIKEIISQNQVDQAIKNFGFNPLTYPNKDYNVGTIIRKHKDGDFEIVCDNKAAFGNTPFFEVSPTSTQNVDILNGVTFKADARFYNVIKAYGGVDIIRSTIVSFSNPSVSEIVDDRALRYSRFRSKNCNRLVQNMDQKHYQMTVIRKVLEGSFNYVFTFKNKISIGAKLAFIKNLEPLGLKVKKNESEKITMSGKNLIWGIKDSPYLLSITGIASSMGKNNQIPQKISIIKLISSKPIRVPLIDSNATLRMHPGLKRISIN